MERNRVRVVMTVDNGVVGDSRVIKSARSAREAGFDVIVLGYGASDPDISGVDARLYPAVPAQRETSLFRWALRSVAMDPGDMRAHRLNQTNRGPLGSAWEKLQVAARWRLNRFAGYGPREWQRLYDLAEKSPRLAERLGIWHHLDPSVAGLNRGILGPLVALQPDVIHVHDYRTLPAATAAKRELARQGRRVRVVYDAHEYVPGLLEIGEQRLSAAKMIERDNIATADAVVSVSDDLAARMEADHRLPERPVVVVNAPAVPGPPLRGKGLRDRLGLSEEVPLLLYSGSVGSSRWLTHTVDVLPLVPDAHVVLVVSHPTSNVIKELESRAAGLGVLGRFHVTRYVRPEHLVEFLAGADIGLVPLRHTDNVQDSLPSKTYEYLAAGVPQVVSDQRVLKQFVTDTGIGEVFVADNVESMAAAVRKVLADRPRYRSAITPDLQASLTWSTQADKLCSLYDSLAAGLANPPRAVEGPRSPAAPADASAPEVASAAGDGGVRLAIMPTNTDGQGHAWAAAARALPGVGAMSYATTAHREFPADEFLDHARRSDLNYIAELLERLGEDHTHVLLEAGWTPSEYTYLPLQVCQAVETLEERGVRVGQVFHGQEVRLPSLHRELYPSSVPEPEQSAALEARAAETLAVARWLGLDQFVASPDLVDFLPNATWLPRVVAAECFLPPRERSARPTVVHLPSEAYALSGAVDEALRALAREGEVSLLEREALRPDELIAAADIVVDQVGLGGYGWHATCALAAGRVVLGTVGVSARTVVGDLPIVEVDSVAALPDAIRSVAGLERRAELGRLATAYARQWHDGTAAAEALKDFLGVAQ